MLAVLFKRWSSDCLPHQTSERKSKRRGAEVFRRIVIGCEQSRKQIVINIFQL